MKATMEVMTECVGFREYRTHVTVTSEKGRTLFEQYKVFKNANEVYPPYKALARGINHLPKFGVTHIDVRTNSGPLMWELTGDFNENKSLLGIVHDRLKKTGVVIDGVEGVAAA